MVPLAILALDYALERRTLASYTLAAIALAAVPFTNIPTAIVLGFAVVACSLACGFAGWRLRCATIAGVSLPGYLLIATGLPPSTIHTILTNTQKMAVCGNCGATGTTGSMRSPGCIRGWPTS